MGDGIFTALSGALAQERALEVISNNLANITTLGFKAEQVEFHELLAQSTDKTTNVQVEVAQTRHDFSQGLTKTTRSPLDVALMGPGFLVVDTPLGEKLTRQGALSLRGDGFLQNVDGMLVQGQGGAIRVAPGSGVRIDSFGSIYATPMGAGSRGDSRAETLVDRLRIVEVDEPQLLRREGHGLWDPSATALRRSDTPVEQGSLEQANVNAIDLMSRLITVQRAYESYHRSIETINAMEKKVSNQLG